MKKWFKAHGCSLYGDLSDDKDTIEFTDIIVNEGTEELRLAGIEEAVNKIVSYDFKSCGRTFPNVKKTCNRYADKVCQYKKQSFSKCERSKVQYFFF